MPWLLAVNESIAFEIVRSSFRLPERSPRAEVERRLARGLETLGIEVAETLPYLLNLLGYETAGGVVQGYAVWEVHRIAKPKFDAAFIGTPGSEKHKKQLREYGIRLLRLWVFRLSIFTMLTLLVASLMRGVAE